MGASSAPITQEGATAPRAPSRWTETTLGQLADYINGYAFKPAQWKEQGLPIVRIAQLTDPDGPVDRYPDGLPEHYLIRDGDLIFSWSATLMTLMWDRGPAYLNQHLFRVVARPGVSLEFLHHLLAFNLDALSARAHGTTMRHITRSDLLPFRVAIPSLCEQRRIANLLDTVDEALHNTRRLLVKLGRISEGLLTDLLTRGVNGSGTLRDPAIAPDEFTQTPDGLIPTCWRTSTLGSEFTLQRGFDITVNQQRHGEVPVVSSSGITSLHDTAMDAGPGVVTGRKGKLGDVYLVHGEFWPHDTTLWVKDFHGNDPAFAALFLRSLRLERFDAATSVPTLNRNFIHPLSVSIPPLGEQRRIVTIMAAADDRITREQRVLRKLLMLKQGLANVLLTGPARAASPDEADGA